MHKPLGWVVRERRDSDGSLLDCFVEAPAENGMAYGLEVLGDDYNGFGDEERKLEHCRMIVEWANAAQHPTSAPDSSDALLEAAKAVVRRWDTPTWKDAEPTGAVINRLRAAIAAKGQR